MADPRTILVLTSDYRLEEKISTDMIISNVPWSNPYILEAHYHHFGFDNTIPLVSLTETQFQATVTW
jgi:hypothetical protein